MEIENVWAYATSRSALSFYCRNGFKMVLETKDENEDMIVSNIREFPFINLKNEKEIELNTHEWNAYNDKTNTWETQEISTTSPSEETALSKDDEEEDLPDYEWTQSYEVKDIGNKIKPNKRKPE